MDGQEGKQKGGFITDMLISLLIFIAILSILVVVHEFGHFIMAKRLGVRVEKFSVGFGPKLFSLKRSGTEYLICLIPLGGYVKLAGDNWDEYKGKANEYLSQKVYKRVLIVVCGPIFNYILSFFCFCLIFLIGYPTLTTKVGELMDGYPAKEAGILSGDNIIRVEGKDIKYWEELQEIIQDKTDGSAVNLTLIRGERKLNLKIAPKIETIKNILGQEEKIGLIGIKPVEEFIQVNYGFFGAIKLGAQKLLFMSAITYKAIFRILTGGLSFKDSVTGPLGIFYITNQAVGLGFSYVLNMVAILGVSLAIFNLLPLPILDGGHILFLVIEKLRGKPVSRKIDEFITRVGLSLIVFLAIFIFYNDIIKFGIIGKVVDLINKIK